MTSEPPHTVKHPATTNPVKPKTAGLAWLIGSYTMLGPFSISTYMPFFPALLVSMEATQVELQQTLSVYLAAFGIMMLVYGPLSDAVGRRPVILGGLVVYLVASIGGALAESLGALLVFRTLQGLSVGAGGIAGRAVIRDRHEGNEAQKLLSQVTMVFGLAPAIAPVLGGWLQNWFTWPSVFIFLAVFSAIQLVASYFVLPETLPPEQRTSLTPSALAHGYRTVLKNKPFWSLSLALSGNFLGFFLYVSAAPVFVPEYLGLSKEQFGWLFIPATTGMILGAYLSSKLASRFERTTTVRYGYLTMFLAALLNLAYNAFLPPMIPWAVLPIMLYTVGVSLAAPTITLLTLDLFPSFRGTAASLQAFIQTMTMAFTSGFAAPMVATQGWAMAVAALTFLSMGYFAWRRYEENPLG